MARRTWQLPDALIEDPAGFSNTAMPADAAGDDVWLLADDVAIRPTVSGDGTYSFVVPSGTARVRLQSRRGIAADLAALGVRVSDMVIRSWVGEGVIPADDARLVEAWHAAEQAGIGIWRWTDGSAALPWCGVTETAVGPAMVTVRCATLGEYSALGNRDRAIAGPPA
jgi:hypothetical protein